MLNAAQLMQLVESSECYSVASCSESLIVPVDVFDELARSRAYGPKIRAWIAEHASRISSVPRVEPNDTDIYNLLQRVQDRAQWSCTDKYGNNFPWKIELDNLINEETAACAPTARRFSDTPDAKLSNILRCVEAARNDPEIWERVLAQAKRPYVDPADTTKYNQDVAVLFDVVHLIGDFTCWFRKNFNIDENPSGYTNVYNLLLAIARSEVSHDDIKGLKDRVGSYFVFDDIESDDCIK